MIDFVSERDIIWTQISFFEKDLCHIYNRELWKSLFNESYHIFGILFF